MLRTSAATLIALLALVSGFARAQNERQSPSGPIVAGRIVDSSSNRPIPSASVEVRFLAGDPSMWTTSSDGSGRFRVVLPRPGSIRVSVRRLGYEPRSSVLDVTADSSFVVIAMPEIAQPLAPLVVEESAIEGVLREMQRELRAIDHTRVFDEAALARTGQLLAGPFLLGQGGILPVSCQRSREHLPAGKVRTVPVEREPGEIYWPCTLRRGKPVSVMVSIDNGPMRDFSSISSRELDEFAMVVITHGQFVRAYTKLFVQGKAMARRRNAVPDRNRIPF